MSTVSRRVLCVFSWKTSYQNIPRRFRDRAIPTEVQAWTDTQPVCCSHAFIKVIQVDLRRVNPLFQVLPCSTSTAILLVVNVACKEDYSIMSGGKMWRQVAQTFEVKRTGSVFCHCGRTDRPRKSAQSEKRIVRLGYILV